MVRATAQPYRRAMTPLSLRRTSISFATALAGVCMAAAPALASITDGTSNTIQVAAATIDQAHHRVLIIGPEPTGGLTPGQHIRTVQLVGQRFGYTFENVMVESVTGTPSALSLNFTKVEFSTHDSCIPGVDTCLIESDGLYPPVT